MAYLISPTDEVVVWRDLLGVSLTMEREHTVYLLFTQRNVLAAEGFAWREKESTCIQFSPPYLIVKKKSPPFFPHLLVFPDIFYIPAYLKNDLYIALRCCACECWMCNAKTCIFFLFGSICRKSVIASPVLHSAKLKKKTTHKAVPHLRIVLYFSRQIKIFNKLCTF